MFWQTKTAYEFGPFRVDPRERQLFCNGEIVRLRPKVFDVLLVLVQNSGHTLSKDEVIRLVWPNTAIEEGNLARNISTLRSALGERPRECQYIETIPWRGYRFVANVREVRDQQAAPAIESIAVLPFVNVNADSKKEYLCDGITDSLIISLAQLTNLRVTSRNSAFHYKGRETDARVVGRELKVQALLMGRIVESHEVLSISVELIETSDDRQIWGAQYLRKIGDLFSAQETIAREIVEKLRLELSGHEQHSLARLHTRNNEAYLLYLKGRYHFNKLTPDSVQKGVEYFQEAIDKDPSYALAFAGLADCHNYLAHRDEAKKAVLKALELDETLGEAHASLGFFRFLYDWDFAGAEREFQRALVLSPNYAEAHHWYAIYLANLGRHDEAEQEADRAVQLDPLSLLMNMTPALNFYLARRHDEAIEQLQRIIEMEPNFIVARSVLGSVLVQKGLYDEAVAEYEKVMDLIKGAAMVETSVKAVMAHALAKSGKRSESMNLLEAVTQAGTASPYSIAGVYAALGDSDSTFAWLEKAYEQRDVQMVSLKVDPTLDGVRTDPRFAGIVRLVGLPS
jgi:TolB-like protein/tetratricopeptide (TPR) repeat protein